MKKTFYYKDLKIIYYFKPLTKNQNCSFIFEEMKKVNENNLKVNYSIFSENLDRELFNDFFKNSLICLIYKKNTIIGFYYNYIVNAQTNLVHLGLIMLNKNKDPKLFNFVEQTGNIILYQEIGKFYITTITTIPKVVEYVHNTFSNVQPSLQSRITNQRYKEIAQEITYKYIEKYITNGRSVSLNLKNFLIDLNEKEDIGFKDDFYTLPKANKNKFNVYCFLNIDYFQGKDMILVGEYNKKNYIKDTIITFALKRL